ELCFGWGLVGLAAPLLRLIRRDFSYSMTCRVRRSKGAAKPTKPQPKHNSGQLKTHKSTKTKKPKTGGALWQVKKTASRITSYRRKSFSAKPASSSNAMSGSRLHSSSSESTGRKL